MQVTIVLKTDLGTILENSFDNKTIFKIESFVYNLICTNNCQGIMYRKKPRSL